MKTFAGALVVLLAAAGAQAQLLSKSIKAPTAVGQWNNAGGVGLVLRPDGTAQLSLRENGKVLTLQGRYKDGKLVIEEGGKSLNFEYRLHEGRLLLTGGDGVIPEGKELAFTRDGGAGAEPKTPAKDPAKDPVPAKTEPSAKAEPKEPAKSLPFQAPKIAGFEVKWETATLEERFSVISVEYQRGKGTVTMLLEAKEDEDYLGGSDVSFVIFYDKDGVKLFADKIHFETPFKAKKGERVRAHIYFYYVVKEVTSKTTRLVVGLK